MPPAVAAEAAHPQLPLPGRDGTIEVAEAGDAAHSAANRPTANDRRIRAVFIAEAPGHAFDTCRIGTLFA